MPTIEKIAFVLFKGFYKYVLKTKSNEYINEFDNRNRYDSVFILRFFPKYINFNKWVKKPKEPYDVLLFNYWLTEVNTYGLKGLKGSKMINEYIHKRNKIINKRLKEEERSKKQSS